MCPETFESLKTPVGIDLWELFHPANWAIGPISLGGDADTLDAISGPMAYAHYKEMPDSLVYKALKTFPYWMVSVNERFDKLCTDKLDTNKMFNAK